MLITEIIQTYAFSTPNISFEAFNLCLQGGGGVFPGVCPLCAQVTTIAVRHSLHCRISTFTPVAESKTYLLRKMLPGVNELCVRTSPITAVLFFHGSTLRLATTTSSSL